MLVKAIVNRYVLSFDLKVSISRKSVISLGRLFHAVGPATKNALSPNLRLVFGTLVRPLKCEKCNTEIQPEQFADGTHMHPQRQASIQSYLCTTAFVQCSAMKSEDAQGNGLE